MVVDENSALHQRQKPQDEDNKAKVVLSASMRGVSIPAPPQKLGDVKKMTAQMATGENCRFEPFLEGKTSVIRGIIEDGKSSTTIQA